MYYHPDSLDITIFNICFEIDYSSIFTKELAERVRNIIFLKENGFHWIALSELAILYTEKKLNIVIRVIV